MKVWFYLGLLLVLAACDQQNATRPQSTLEQLRGQWVLINYWAQWCKPCIEEIPELNAVDESYDNITVLGVNYDGATGEELARQAGALGVTFSNLARDPAGELGISRPVVLPSTLVLDPTSQVVTTQVGPQTLETLKQATELPQKSKAQ